MHEMSIAKSSREEISSFLLSSSFASLERFPNRFRIGLAASIEMPLTISERQRFVSLIPISIASFLGPWKSKLSMADCIVNSKSLRILEVGELGVVKVEISMCNLATPRFCSVIFSMKVPARLTELLTTSSY